MSNSCVVTSWERGDVVLAEYFKLRTLAGAERGSRVLQGCPNIHCGRVRAPEHAPRGPFRVLERRHGLAELVERGGGVLRRARGRRRGLAEIVERRAGVGVERPRVNPP